MELLAVIGIVGALIVGAVCGHYSRSWEVDGLKRDIRDYRARYLHRNGWSAAYGQYRLVSIDGGGAWHELDETGKIIGPADRALVKHLDGLDALTSYVAANGPIGSRPITKDDVRALERAGFEVRTP